MVGNPDEWLVEMGASRHFCNDKTMFKTFKPITEREQVFMGNSSVSEFIPKLYYVDEFPPNSLALISIPSSVSDEQGSNCGGVLIPLVDGNWSAAELSKDGKKVQTPKDRSRASCSESSSDPHPETLESVRQKKWSHRSSRKDEKPGILPSPVLIYSKSRIFLAPPATDMELAGWRVTPLGVHLRLTTRLARLACSGAS
nr:Retrovirus-related Pol polyprotein from transposon TNT 1-94 [Ipomoea batatas]